MSNIVFALISSLAAVRRTARRLSLLPGLFCVLATTRLFAVSPVPYTEAVTFSFKLTGGGSANMYIYDDSGSTPVSAWPNGVNSESVPAVALLIPGKQYNISFQATSLTEYWMSFIAPEGYEVLIDGYSTNLYGLTYSGTTSVSDPHTIQIRPLAQATRLDAGVFTGIDVGKAISWSVGLGGLRSGHTAGQILFRVQDLTNSPPTNDSPASRDRLVYVAPPNSNQINLVRDGPATTTLRQISVPQTVVDLVDDPGGGYTMKFYANGIYSNSLYTFTGSPWRTIQVQSPSANQLVITETEGSVSRVSNLALTSGNVQSGTYALTLQEGDGTIWRRTTTHASTFNSSTNTRADVVTVRTGGASGTIVAKTQYNYAMFGFGEQLTSVVADPDTGGAQLSTNFTYATNGGALGNYGRVQSVTSPTGAWSATVYYDDWNRRGMLQNQYQPFGTTGPATVTMDVTQGKAVSYDYGADWSGRYTRPILQQVYVKNHLVGEREWVYDNNNNPSWSLARDEATVASHASASDAPSSRIETVSAQSGSTDEVGEPYLIKNADQSQTSISRLAGDYNSSTGVFTANTTGVNWRELKVHGSTNSSGADQQNSYDSQNFDPIYLIANKSSLEVTIRDVAGNVILEANYAYTGSGSWAALNSTAYTYSVGSGRMIQSVASNDATVTNTFIDGHLHSSVDAAGTETDFTYDEIGRVHTQVKKGVAASGIFAAQGDLTTTYTYDGANHVVTQVLTGASGSETITNAGAYDFAGRLTSQTPAGLPAVTYTYDTAARTETATAPDGGTTTKTFLLDGQLASVTGTAVVWQYYTYDYDATASQLFTQVNSGTSNSSRWQKSWTDWLGRVVRTERPGFSVSSQQNFVEQNLYKSDTGLLWKSTRTGYSPKLYQYDTLGHMNRSGLDVGSVADALDLASSDRIADSNAIFEKIAGNWWLTTTTVTYPFVGASGTIPVSTRRERLTGFATGRLAEVHEVDIEGNDVSVSSDVDRTTKTLTSTKVGSCSCDVSSSVQFNGLPVSTTTRDSLTYLTQYDALGRKWKETDPRNSNVTTTSYYSGTALVQTVTDAATNAVITQAYDYNGRIAWNRDAASHYTRFGYNTRSQVTNQWGDATYPVAFGYDPTYGDRTSMSTYQGAPSADSATWPSVGAANTTTWYIDTPTGLIWKKTDASSPGNTVEFDYDLRGQTATRKWARSLVNNSSARVTASYDYYSGTGELHTVSYNDSGETIPTPGVTYTYTRTGQIATVADATGTRTFNYNSATPWRLESELLPSFFGSSRLMTQLYDGVGSGVSWNGYTTALVTGRPSGFTLGIVGNTIRDLQQKYTYSNASRFVGVSARAGAGLAQDFVYGYKTSSALIDGYTAGSFATSRDYESTRDMVTRLEAKWGTTSLTKFDFTSDTVGRRQTARQSGSAFADYYSGPGYSGVYNNYTYNARSELQTAAMYRGDTPSATPSSSDELPGRRFEYRYDSVGNRTTAGETGSANTGDDEFTVNALNQYLTRENNTVRVVGTAASAARVAVGGAPSTGKLDRAWGADILPANSAPNSPVQGTATVYAGLIGAGSGGADLVKTETKPYFVPPATQTFKYDADGNLTADSTSTSNRIWNYTYDAENRLRRMASALPSGQGFKRVQLDFTYDYLGRRVEKKVTDLDTAAQAVARFIYDGWNLVAELDGSGANIQRSYAWGLDLTGSPTKAGGVGALLRITNYTAGSPATSYYPTYDGNGNVVSLVNATSGNLAVVYEYDPYGNYLRAAVSDSAVGDNPFRFSTKYTDAESGLVYYGLRYYSPVLGRWINRDPAEEQGGFNLYGFCGNNGVSRWDYLGMWHWACESHEVGSDRHSETTCWWAPDSADDSFTALYGGVSPSGADHPTINVAVTDNPNSIPAGANILGRETVSSTGNGSYTVSPHFDLGLSDNHIIGIPHTSITLAPLNVLAIVPDGGSGGGAAPNNTGNYGSADPTAPWHYTSLEYTTTVGSISQGRTLLNQIANDYPTLASLNNPAKNVSNFSRDGNTGSFSPRGLLGTLITVGNFLEFSPNDYSWKVQFSSAWSSDQLSFTQTATTIGDHPLVGTRTWSASFNPNTLQVSYGTQAYEQARGGVNSFNFSLAGSSAQQGIWNTYYGNINSNYLPAGNSPSSRSVDKSVPVNPYYGR